MKTRVFFDQGSLVLTLALCLNVASCNKDDYYKKEFLDNPYQENPPTQGPVDIGDQGGTDSGVTTGGTDGSVTGGTTGGADGSATGGSTGNTDGSVAGGSAGGVDGSTAGGTNGGTDGGTDGSVAGGTNGGTDGSVTGGTAGGTDGSVTGGSTGGAVYTEVEESFQQAQSQTKKLDIVWIIDSSGSMADEQDALGANFNTFIQDFITKDVDFKMGITTTDVRNGYKGVMVADSDTKLTSAKAKEDEAQFLNDFKRMVRVGTGGSGYEKGLEASEGFMDRNAASFLRPDAYLAVVILSDEEDQSPKTVEAYTNYLKSFKAEAGLVKVYSIVDATNSNCCSSGITTGHARYESASEKTSGIMYDIREDFGRSLSAMGDHLINLLDSFALASAPVAGSLRVFVNNVETTDYAYDATSQSIKFDSNHLPPVGAQIKVQYLKQ